MRLWSQVYSLRSIVTNQNQEDLYMPIPTIKWHEGKVKLIDQTLLPNELKHIYCETVKEVWEAIKRAAKTGSLEGPGARSSDHRIDQSVPWEAWGHQDRNNPTLAAARPRRFDRRTDESERLAGTLSARLLIWNA